jgi:cytochrome c oxidase subunit I
VVQFLLLFAIPVITVALFLLMFQRNFDATFFSVEAGADPLLWQHLFWIFGHPEVYILILPAFGIISEVLPVFSPQAAVRLPFVVFSGAAIGFVGWGVWAHHMFASGLGPVSVAVFSVATMAIAIPTGVKIINWTITMWGGKLHLHHRDAVRRRPHRAVHRRRPVGRDARLSPVRHPADRHLLHRRPLPLRALRRCHPRLFAGLYYWWPKIFGKLLNERWGKANFWTMIIGMNLTFGPMHIIGLQGQPRRMYVWTEARAGEGFFNLGFWNLVSTIGSFILAMGVLFFFINVWVSHRKGTVKAPLDPWDARSLEWITTSPPKEHNFDTTPTVHALDEFFHRKYEDRGTDGHHDYHQVATVDDIIAEIHANKRFAHPPALAVVLADRAGVLAADHRLRADLQLLLLAAGAAMARSWHVGWALEPSTAPDSDFEPPADGGGNADGGGRQWLMSQFPSTPRRPRRLARPTTAGATTPPPACRTTSWPCGCSSAPSACSSAA